MGCLFSNPVDRIDDLALWQVFQLAIDDVTPPWKPCATEAELARLEAKLAAFHDYPNATLEIPALQTIHHTVLHTYYQNTREQAIYSRNHKRKLIRGIMVKSWILEYDIYECVSQNQTKDGKVVVTEDLIARCTAWQQYLNNVFLSGGNHLDQATVTWLNKKQILSERIHDHYKSKC